MITFNYVERQYLDMFNTVPDERIADGEVTDKYFQRTEESLDGDNKNPHVVAEVTETQRQTGEWRVLGGVNEALNLLEGLDLTVRTLPEGTAFDGGPVMQIEGSYRDFARYETALLGILSQSSGYLSAAASMRQEYPDENLLSFGGRHIHPSMGNVLERAAHVAGFDGFSLMSAEEMLDQEANGTMPHALILSYGEGNQEEAWNAFNDNVPDHVPRIALVDTFADEVVETERAVKALGDDLDGVRIDTTSSRRGDFEQILEEVTWKLESLGREDVDIFVSGGMDIEGIAEVQELVDGVGVGSYISDGRPLDFGLDIIEVDGEEISKRGKFSSVKSVYRTSEGNHVIKREDDPVPDTYESLFETAIDDGDRIANYTVDQSRQNCQDELSRISGEITKK